MKKKVKIKAEAGPKVTMPSVRITSGGFRYKNAAATDIQETWRKYGWVPAGEEPHEIVRPVTLVKKKGAA